MLAVWIASRDPRVPWYAKVLGSAVAAYAFSPIDLIPDFIPVLGYLDDIIIVPAGIFLAVGNMVDVCRPAIALVRKLHFLQERLPARIVPKVLE